METSPMHEDQNNQINLFINEKFNPEIAARRFFASHGDPEKVKTKLNEMAFLQQSVERVLKQEVRDNYGAFLQASEHIHQVGEEVTALKHLIQNTLKLIDDGVRHNQLTDAHVRKSSFTNLQDNPVCSSPIPASAVNCTSVSAENLANPSSTAIVTELPPWVQNAQDELERYIVEQQFTMAVELVLNIRSYAKTIKDDASASAPSTNDSSSYYFNAVQQVQRAVESSSVPLVEKIKTSLLRLPSSSLWGSREQFTKLKLLVSLDMNKKAAEIYIRGEKRAIKRVIKTLDFSGESLAFVTELSKQFFIILARAIHLCIELFDLVELRHGYSGGGSADRGSRIHSGTSKASDTAKTRGIMSIILLWMKDEIRVLVDLVFKKVQPIVHEFAALILIHIRKRHILNAQRVVKQERELSDGTRPLPQRPDEPTPTLGATSLSSSALIPHETGALSYLSACLDRLMGQARQARNETARVCVGWLLLPEIEKFMRKYTDEFAKEIEIEVRLEPWRPVVTSRTSYSIHLPGPVLSSDIQDAALARDMPSSFRWMVDVLQHFLYEVCTLLKVKRGDAGERPTTNSGLHPSNERSSLLPTGEIAAAPSTSHDVSGYNRADVGEVEVAAISCLLSLAVRFVLELEQVDLRLLEAQQVQVFINCQQCLREEVLPSLQQAVVACCVLEPSKTAAATTFQVLSPRLESLATATSSHQQSIA